MKNYILYILLGLTLKALAQPKYHEDLSKERLKFKETTLLDKDSVIVDTVSVATHQQNAKVEEVVDGLVSYYEDIEYVKGKRILIYSGDSEAKADELKEELKNVLEEMYGIDHGVFYDKDWKSPAWRVVVGCFKDKLDAYRIYASIKEIFPRALIIPDNRIPKDCIQ